MLCDMWGVGGNDKPGAGPGEAAGSSWKPAGKKVAHMNCREKMTEFGGLYLECGENIMVGFT